LTFIKLQSLSQMIIILTCMALFFTIGRKSDGCFTILLSANNGAKSDKIGVQIIGRLGINILVDQLVESTRNKAGNKY
jgi:hypothetical protein